MKKFLKPVLITFASLFALLAIAGSIILWFISTPERISPEINKQVKEFFTCEVEIGKVELTFFRTFPRFGLKIDEFRLINAMEGSPSDTLVDVGRLIGEIDIKAFWKEDKIILSGIILENGFINAYVDSLGNNNFDVFVTDTTETPDKEWELSFIDIGNVKLNNINFSYLDESLKLNSSISGLYAEIQGTLFKDDVNSDIRVNESNIFLEHNGEKYLNNESVKLNFPLEMILSQQFFQINKAHISVNDLELFVDGSIDIDTANGDVHSDIKYNFKRWPLKSIMAIVPPSLSSHFEGIEANIFLTSEGVISGTYNDSIMPLLDVHLVMEDGHLDYSGFHLPLSDINGDINIYTDLISNEISYFQINALNGKTPQSTFNTRGTVNNLFSDIYGKLTTNVYFDLAEFNPMFHDSLNINMNGRIEGNLKSGFSLSQIEEMQIEKMELSGSLNTFGLDIIYDSLWLKTNLSKIDFLLPNHVSSTQNTGFASATVKSDNFTTGKIDDYQVFSKNIGVMVETSDFRDTTKTPDLVCSFFMDTLSVNMDTINIALEKQSGKASVNPVFDNPDNPEIKLLYDSEGLELNAGKETVLTNKFHVDVNIINDKSQTDFFLKWLAKGFVDIDRGFISTSFLSYPIVIPSIKMDFDPEKLDIKESMIVIDNSDFELSGIVDNALSYFRGDSILRGDFNFVSNNTDIMQLMALTSGIGVEDDKIAKNPNTSSNPRNQENIESTQPQEHTKNQADSMEYFGPYMVPEGIDFKLSANVEQATFGNDTARGISGEVSIKDGVLLLDDLAFTTSAARMQLTSIYRTPRKNHLFLGLDYHMLDIEIEELLNMIPDIDSLMPMLRSFRGKGEFHIAVEGYLDSTYNIKGSTLRGASSIRGSDLVLLDGETFSEIAKTLRFTREAENRVDSLSAEFSIFREEIDVYPFLIVMDRYSAVVAGRHNFDFSFDYHITVVDSPLPSRFAIDINGDMGKLNYRPARTRYPEFYRPASRGVVESRQLEIRRMIREALTERVVE